MRKSLVAAAAAFLMGSAPAAAQPDSWSPEPWLEDLTELRTALETKYANLQWLLTERELDLAGLFDRAGGALRGARSDSDAVAIFNRIVARIDDGHVALAWPRSSTPAAAPSSPPTPSPTIEAYCRARGFDARVSPWVGPALPGYVAVADGDRFPAGVMDVGGIRAGILRIGKFEPGGTPSLCPDAVRALALALDRPCDIDCGDRIATHAYWRLTTELEERIGQLKAAGASILIVDVSGNGGGSEWVQAVARMLSVRRLVSQRMGFVRGPHWAGTWTRVADRLRGFARAASTDDRARLLAWAAQADAARAEAERRCPPAGGCPWLGQTGYATGLVGSAASAEFAGKEWAPWVFNPSQYPYHDGVWGGPVVVLVDDGTASAAEEFAAMLQDNEVAFVVGGRTAGLGCGHTWGGTPTRLSNSGAVLSLPDCVRFRADGSNEVRGVIPDLLIGWRVNDGGGLRARMLQRALPAALAGAAERHRSTAARSTSRNAGP